jgi:uncharacterized protein YndB with AHSA1/START domain
MPEISHDFQINAPARRVFQVISSPEGLDQWWTKRSSGNAAEGMEYQLWFGPEYDWRAVVSRCVPDKEFELKLVKAHEDWMGSRVRFQLKENNGKTTLCFQHKGWPEENDHYRVSCFCWAMYLRLLKRYVERGERVPYEERLEA